MLAGLVIGAAWGQAAPEIAWSPVVEVRHRAYAAPGPYAEQRARFGLEVKRLGVSARVTLQDVRGWAVEDGAVQMAGLDPTVAEGWVRVEGHLSRKVGAVATVGRQTVALHEGRLVGEDAFVAQGRQLDAVRIVGRADPVSLEYVGARHFERDGITGLVLGQPVDIVRLGASGENPMTTWVADALWVLDGVPDARRSTAGAYLRFDTGRWRGRAEGYVQATDGGTATLLGVSAGWVFGPNERVVVHGRYDALSGEYGTHAPAWAPVLGDTHRFNGLLDLYADPGARPDGLADVQLVVEARPAPPLATTLAVHRFSTLVDVRPYGTELDASVAYSFSPFVTLRLAGGWFTPDPPGTAGSLALGYVELDATF